VEYTLQCNKKIFPATGRKKEFVQDLFRYRFTHPHTRIRSESSSSLVIFHETPGFSYFKSIFWLKLPLPGLESHRLLHSNGIHEKNAERSFCLFFMNSTFNFSKVNGINRFTDSYLCFVCRNLKETHNCFLRIKCRFGLPSRVPEWEHYNNLKYNRIYISQSA
jgi:hypothetical protein